MFNYFTWLLKFAVKCGVIGGLLMLLILGSTGCSATDASTAEANAASAGPHSYAFVAGNHANAPRHTGAFAQNAAEDAVATGGYVDVIAVDGAPTTAIGAGAVLGSDSPSTAQREMENDAQVAQVVAAIGSSQAKSPEADTLGAIAYAARSLTAAPDGTRTVIVADSGLSTAGVLDFTNAGTLTADADEIAAYYAERNLLPDLSSIDQIVWYGIGDVAGDQATLDNATRSNLRSIWTAVLNAAGCANVRFDETPTAAGDGTQEAGELPAVSAVSVPAYEPFHAPTTAGETQVDLPQWVLAFQPDSAAFADEAQARDVLASYADALAASPALTVRIEGHTASYPWDPAYALDLSRQRANTVREALINLGASPDQITADGQGDAGAGHVNDLDENGQQVPELAQQNRKVSFVFTQG